MDAQETARYFKIAVVLVVIVIVCIFILALAMFLLTKSPLFIGATLLIFGLSFCTVYSVSSLTNKLTTPHSPDKLASMSSPEKDKLHGMLSFVGWTSISLGAASLLLLIVELI